LSEIRTLSFRVYLEGVLLPEGAIAAAQIQVAPGSPKAFQISLPPLPLSLAKRIRPRTHVAVFYNDSLGDVTDTAWKLWAEGEILGYSFQKAAHGSIRTVLRMEGIENYWQYTYALHFQSAKSLGGSNFHDAEIIMGTAGRVLTLDFPAGANPINVQNQVLSAIDAPEDTPFPELFVRLFRSIETLNQFFADSSERLRIGDRLSWVSDDDIERLIPAKTVSALMGRSFSQSPSDARLISIMQSLMANVHYGYQTIAMPPFVDGRPAEFLIKPDVPFIAPPRCNVLFPGRTSSFTFQRSYLAEPTRARFSLSVGMRPGADRQFRQHYYAPEQMEDVVNTVLSTDGEPRNIEAIQLSGDDLDEESREDIKGVIPLVSVIPTFDSIVLGGEVGEDERKEYFSALTAYNLKLAQHAPRVLTMSGPFNPYVVCGLPGVLLTEQGAIFGNIQSVTHSAHSAGVPKTNVVMTHCREEDLSSLREPVWKNSRYTDREQIDTTYASLLGDGHASMLAPVTALADVLDTRSVDQAVAGQRLIEAYAAARDKESFEEVYTRRSITTLVDLFGFLKAERIGQNYQGKAFREEWAAVAREVALNLTQTVQDAR
jgi:hypothetical protein